MVNIVPNFLEQFAASLAKIIAPVASTAGPGGRSVHIQSENGLIVLRDGHKTLQNMRPQSPEDYNAKEVLLGISRRVANTAGDGTTSATNIFVKIINIMVYQMKHVASRRAYSTGIKMALQVAKDYIAAREKRIVDPSDIETLKAIATVAASGDADIARYMAEAVFKVGRNGLVTASPNADKWSVDVLPGYIHKAAMWDPNSLPPGNKSFKIENPKVLLIRDIVTKMTDLNTLLSSWKAEGAPPLVIISSSIEGDPRATLIRAVASDGTRLPIYCIAAPKTDEGWTDLAAITGAKIIYAPHGNPAVNAKMDQAGSVLSVSLSVNEAAFTHDGANLAQSGLLDRLDEKEDEERIARLTGAVATVNVPAHTNTSWADVNLRCEDAYFAMRTAIDTGIVPAGYRLMLEAAKAIYAEAELQRGDISMAMNACGDAIVGHYTSSILCNFADLDCFDNRLVDHIIESDKWQTLDLNAKVIAAVAKGKTIGKDFLVDSLEGGLVEPVGVTEAVLDTALGEAASYAEVEYGILYNQ